jgi:SAM-dependent methyltransferase
MAAAGELLIGERIRRLLRHLGLEKAHFAAREFQEFDGLARFHSELIASLTLAFPPRTLKTDVLEPLGRRLLCFYGGNGPNATLVREAMASLPDATQKCFENYLDVNWSDVAADHAHEIGDVMLEFLARMDRDGSLPPTNLSPREGEVAGITYRVLGSGGPLVLLPLVLAPSQWEPLLPQLSKHYCVIVLGGPELGGVQQLEARGRTESYRRALRAFSREIEIMPGEKILEVGCGSGVLTRMLVETTQRANPIVAVDINQYFLREATSLAKKLGVADLIEFRDGSATALPFTEEVFDVVISATVMEEVDADRMISEMVRVAKPGGRIGVMIRAEDMQSFANISLRANLRTKVESPRGNVSEGGCADATLYRRFRDARLTSLKIFPLLVPFMPDEPHGKRLIAGIVALLNSEELEEWNTALERAGARELLFIARPFHCAVGTKPMN